MIIGKGNLNVLNWVERNKKQLSECGTKWLAFYKVEFVNGVDNSGYKFIKKCCKQRNCDCPVCIGLRKSRIKKQIKRYFDLSDKFRHITLTTGKNKALKSKQDIQKYERFVLNFLRRLTRGKKARSHKVLWIIEAKKQDKGKFHLHFHLVFLGFCPHHSTVHRLWKDVCGEEWRTQTKYRTSKRSIMNYFAYRCATAGKNMTSEEYISLVYKKRMFRVFGGLIGKNFLSLYKRTQLNQEDCDIFVVYYYIGSFSSHKEETRPPPDIKELAKQMWEDRF